MPATYYVNAAGSNTAPYDTVPKGATSEFATGDISITVV
jgi:hypothetical protein